MRKKKYKTQSEIDAGRSVKRMNKIAQQNKKREKGWHKASTYRKPDTEKLIFIPIPGSNLFHPVIVKKEKKRRRKR